MERILKNLKKEPIKFTMEEMDMLYVLTVGTESMYWTEENKKTLHSMRYKLAEAIEVMVNEEKNNE